ncbi:hypothetical protein [Methylobacterium nodulans]|uniref:hypothetical protein n=1 Tax=Methylobacterium nodulans TaxID=114616 RepID=UPI001FCCB29B|nr:hypothetical protein [Methylobacterium nodulans]
MVGPAKHSPKTRGVFDLEERVRRLDKFEKWGQVTPRPLEEWAGIDVWNTYWKKLDAVIEKMKEAQNFSLIVKKNIIRSFHESGVRRPQIKFASEVGISIKD